MTVTRPQVKAASPPWAWIAAALAVIALLGFMAWAFMKTRPTTATAAKRDIHAVIPLQGEVVIPPGESAAVTAHFKAPVAKVYAAVGQEVHRGDTLIELQFSNAQAAYEAARQHLKSAQAAYDSGAAEYDRALSEARRRLSEAAQLESQAATPDTSITVEPDGTRVQVQSEPDPGLSAEAAQQRAAAERYIADISQQKRVALAPLQAQLDQARDAFNQARGGRKMALIRAPIDGTLMSLNAAVGQVVGEKRDEPVATIVDLGALVIQAGIPEEQASSVRPDLPVKVVVEQLPTEKFEGKVDRITTTPDGFLKKGGLLAIIDFKNEGGHVKPQMKASAQVDAGEVKDVLAVPVDAVKYEKGRAVVKLQRGERWEEAIVETGLSDGKYVEIKSGLKEGDVVQVPKPLIET